MCVSNLTTVCCTGHGYLSAALPPPAAALQAMADQVEGNSGLLQAAMALAEQLLRLVPLLLGACAHLSPEMPLQQYWAVVSFFRIMRNTGARKQRRAPCSSQQLLFLSLFYAGFFVSVVP